MDLLRFITAGSIDDGKSTLTGKLLHDTGNIKEDIAHSIKITEENINLAHITDGLRSEREGGITIDIGYKYFNTIDRKFIIADAPGHFQYTKNLVTGASNADLMIVLIDAQNGVTSQTKMHLMVASFLKLRHILVAINKMDLVGYKESVYNDIKNEAKTLAAKLDIEDIDFIPISALKGDNVLQRATHINWYNAPSLVERLNGYETNKSDYNLPVRVRIQNIIQDKDKQLCFGKILSGVLSKADVLSHYLLNKEVEIDTLLVNNESGKNAKAGDNICLILDKSVILESGNILGTSDNRPMVSDEFDVDICWLETETELKKGSQYLLKLNSPEIPCAVSGIIHKRTITDLGYVTTVNNVSVNEFARIKLKIQRPVVFDSYSQLPKSGRGILIDVETNNTVAAVIVV